LTARHKLAHSIMLLLLLPLFWLLLLLLLLCKGLLCGLM
jgi:hypothetical protein